MPSPRDIAAGFALGATLAGGGAAIADRPQVDVIAASIDGEGAVTLTFVARADGLSQPWSERAQCADNVLEEVARLCNVVDGETDRSDNRSRPDALRSLEKRVLDRQPDGKVVVKDANEDARKAGLIE